MLPSKKAPARRFAAQGKRARLWHFARTNPNGPKTGSVRSRQVISRYQSQPITGSEASNPVAGLWSELERTAPGAGGAIFVPQVSLVLFFFTLTLSLRGMRAEGCDLEGSGELKIMQSPIKSHRMGDRWRQLSQGCEFAAVCGKLKSQVLKSAASTSTARRARRSHWDVLQRSPPLLGASSHLLIQRFVAHGMTPLVAKQLDDMSHEMGEATYGDLGPNGILLTPMSPSAFGTAEFSLRRLVASRTCRPMLSGTATAPLGPPGLGSVK